MSFEEEIFNRLDDLDKKILVLIFLDKNTLMELADELKNHRIHKLKISNKLEALEKAGLIDSRKIGTGEKLIKKKYYLTDFGRRMILKLDKKFFEQYMKYINEKLTNIIRDLIILKELYPDKIKNYIELSISESSVSRINLERFSGC